MQQFSCNALIIHNRFTILSNCIIEQVFLIKFKRVLITQENSDWTAFLEALRRDLRQKQDKIENLEKCLKFRAKDFSKDPSETQKRFNSLYGNLKRTEEKENELIQKRIDLIEKQTTELQRLHGLVVVGDDGKIVRKLRP